MSVILQKKTVTPYDKLALLLENADESVVDKLKSDFKVKELCIAGFLNGIMKGDRKRSQLDFYADAKKLGFTNEELEERKMCVVNGCPYYGDMFVTLNHLVGHHKIPFKNVAKLIPFMKDDDRPVPHGLNSIKTGFQTGFMGTD